MAAVTYPATLPVPQTSHVTPAERRALSEAARPLEARALQRDRLEYERVVWPPMTPAKCETILAWWRDTLIYGGAWFSAAWPLPRGMVTAVRKFREQPRWEYVPGGYWRLSALCEVRGAGELPNDGFTPFMYVGIDGNSYSAPPVVTKIKASTRTIVGSGDTQYGGAVSHLGLLSQDAEQLYISVVNGIGNGTFPMQDEAPFNYGDGEANTDWVFNAIYNPHSQVRAYTGYGAFIDLRGAVTISVDTAGLIEATHLMNARLLHKTGTNHIFVMNVNSRGVIMVDTLSGDVQQVSPISSFYPRAMYYSPDTNRLYIEGRETLISAPTVKAFDGDTFAVVDTFADNVIAEGQMLGNSIYLGDETFVACESTSAPQARLWRVSFAQGHAGPSLFGSAVYIARDEDTGYIWATWRTDGGTVTPIGSMEVFDGAYALVYDPEAMTLIDAIRLGDTGADLMSIVSRAEASV